jgi:hypothetical protein
MLTGGLVMASLPQQPADELLGGQSDWHFYFSTDHLSGKGVSQGFLTAP